MKANLKGKYSKWLFACLHSFSFSFLLPLIEINWIERMNSRDQRPYLFIETKDSFWIKKDFNSHSTVFYADIVRLLRYLLTNVKTVKDRLAAYPDCQAPYILHRIDWQESEHKTDWTQTNNEKVIMSTNTLPNIVDLQNTLLRLCSMFNLFLESWFANVEPRLQKST